MLDNIYSGFMSTEANIAKLLPLSEDELMVEIGTALLGTPAFPPNRMRLIEAASKWLTIKNDELASTICANERCKQLAKQDLETHEVIILIAAVSDAISHLALGIAPVTVAVLLVRRGVHRLCSSRWEVDKR